MIQVIYNLSILLMAQANSDLRAKAQDYLSNPHKVVELYTEHSRQRNAVVNTELETFLHAIHLDVLTSFPENAPKHVFYTLSDDQGFGDIGYNDETFVTPALDFFASKGTKFDNFYVHVR
jgi:hypothetical protein